MAKKGEENTNTEPTINTLTHTHTYTLKLTLTERERDTQIVEVIRVHLEFMFSIELIFGLLRW